MERNRRLMESEQKALTHEEMLEIAYEREESNKQLEEQKQKETDE